MKSLDIKSIFSVFLLYFLICTLNCSNAIAKNKEFYYKLDERSRATITAYVGMKSNVIIPNKIDGFKVIAIDQHAFDDSRNTTYGSRLVNVVVSEGITSIGDFAFIGCKNLKSIKLPKSLESLGDQTFINCSSLKNINIPPKVTSLGFSGYMFQECAFTKFVVPSTVKQIPSGTFRICTDLKDFIVYSTDVELGENLFEHGSKNVVIHGYKESTAEDYAKEYGYKFVELKPVKKRVPAKSVKLEKKAYTIYVGQKIQLKANVYPDDTTNKQIRWATSNKAIVIIKNGLVKGLQPGKVKIAVATVDGNHKDYCSITVKKGKIPASKQTYTPSKQPEKKDNNTFSPDVDENKVSDDNTSSLETTTNTKKKPTYKKIINQSSPVPFLIIFIPLTIMFVIDIIIIIRKKSKDDNDNNDDDL